MNQGVMKSDGQLEAAAAQALARHADALKEDLLRTVVLPNMAQLRAGNSRRWNEAGWYASLTPARLEAFALDTAGAEEAPAAEDGNWYRAETDGSGTPFRFFHHSAALELPAPPGPAVLCFGVPHVVMPEALAGLHVTVAGIALAHTLLPSDCYAAEVELRVGAELLAQAGRALRIVFGTPVAAVPALIYPGSADRRLLSLAVTMPSWREA